MMDGPESRASTVALCAVLHALSRVDSRDRTAVDDPMMALRGRAVVALLFMFAMVEAAIDLAIQLYR